MKKLSVCVVGLVGLTSLAVACGSKDEDKSASTKSEYVAGFSGVYSPSGGEIEGIAFGNDHNYVMMGKGCHSQACAEVGAFEYDSAAQELRLTPKGGATRVVRVKVLSQASTGQPISSSGSLVDQSLRTRDLVNSGGALTDGGSNLTPGGIIQLLAQILQAILSGLQNSNSGGDDAGADNSGSGGGININININPGDAGADDGTQDAGSGVVIPTGFKLACFTGLPTPQNTIADLVKYWQDCPNGPLTPGP